MSDHLHRFAGIFARESVTIEYLKSIEVTGNVYPVADPALLMDPVKQEGIDDEMTVEKGAIGINLSPLMAKYVSGGDIDHWTKISASIIQKIAKTTGAPIYLIPHVTETDSNDYIFMQRALSQIHEKTEKIILVPPIYNAAEIKWIIGRMALFAGARTHSTIAALSSGIPTLSFAYSIKAQGINRDIFGHTDYCINPMNLDAKVACDHITSMLDREALIRRELNERIPVIKRSACNAGMVLKKILGEN
jgi:polysaccharide pyruvyl transferase WcaK-like protein